MIVGLLTSACSFGALLPRTARPMVRYYCSTKTPLKSPSFFAMVAGGLGGALTATDLLALGLPACSNLQPSNADDRAVIQKLFTLGSPAGMYGGLRIVGVPRSPAAAAAFTGLIIFEMALANY